MRGLPEMRTPIVEEQSIPATEDELAKRRAAALRAWLEREMGTERAAGSEASEAAPLTQRGN